MQFLYIKIKSSFLAAYFEDLFFFQQNLKNIIFGPLSTCTFISRKTKKMHEKLTTTNKQSFHWFLTCTFSCFNGYFLVIYTQIFPVVSYRNNKCAFENDKKIQVIWPTNKYFVSSASATEESHEL